MLEYKVTEDQVMVYPRGERQGDLGAVRATFARRDYRDGLKMKPCQISVGWGGSGALPGENLVEASLFSQAINQAAAMANAIRDERFPDFAQSMRRRDQ